MQDDGCIIPFPGSAAARDTDRRALPHEEEERDTDLRLHAMKLVTKAPARQLRALVTLLDGDD